MLGNLALDRTSFWYGFLSGALTLFLLALFRPFLARLGRVLISRLQDLRANLTTSAEARFRKEMVIFAQHQHLAASLFSLDEILIPPKLLALPPRCEPQGEAQPGDETEFRLPYLPDYPDLSTHYGGETLGFSQALSGGANLALLGSPGNGKSVALAYLTCLIARRDPSAGKLGAHLPVLVHAADLLPAGSFSGQPLEAIERAILSRSPGLAPARLPELLRTFFQHGRCLLLVDGLDEQPPAIHAELVKFLGELLQAYPATRLVVAAQLEDFSGLTALGLIPVALAAWDRRQQQEFLLRWGENWRIFIQPPAENGYPTLEPALLNSWLQVGSGFLTPLELTLKAWAAYSGDTLGPSPANSMNAYIKRLTAGLPKSRPALESLALQMSLTMHPTLTEKEARKWTGEIEVAGDPQPVEAPTASGEEEKSGTVISSQTNLRGMVSDLVETGILIRHSEGHLGFSHPSVAGFLAAAAIAENRLIETLSTQSEWLGKSETCAWLATMLDVTPLANMYVESGQDPLFRGVLIPAGWLRRASRKAPWRENIQQLLQEVMRSEEWVFSLRLRALVGLIRGEDPALARNIRQMLASPGESTRLLAALGAGFLNEASVADALGGALDDPSPHVRWAASLALATIGSQTALEALAYALLHGDDGARRSAAEALALHPAEGHSALQEGSEVEDLLVRRAVVFGLVKVGQPWARQILEKLAVEDKEWVVRAAAALALEQLHAPPVVIPAAAPALSETPWLIAFAGERGIGVAPGKPALKLLLMALQEGNREQRLAALQALERSQETGSLPMIYQLVAGQDFDLSQAAFQTLWTMAGSGVDVRNPLTYPS